MANQKAYNKLEYGHMFAHYAREAKTYSNPNIDTTRSYLNYNLAAETQPKKQVEFLNEVLAQDDVFCFNRDNVNRIMTWVFQAPKDLPEKEWEDFFKYCHEFTMERYFGDDKELWKKFEISAYVHMDEFLMKDGKPTEEHGSPHLHECFVPAVWDKKKQRWKVSHKALITDLDLKTFHDDLAKYLEERMGHEVHVHEHNTESKGNLTVLRLQLDTAKKELEEAQQQKEEALQQKAKTEQENADLKAENKDLKKENKAVKKENRNVRKKLDRAETMLKQVQSQQKIREGEAIPDYEEVGFRTKYARYSLKDNKILRTMASDFQADRDAEKPLIGTELEKTLNEALSANEQLYQASEEKDKKISECNEEINLLRNKNQNLEVELNNLKEQVQDLIHGLGQIKEYLPERVQNLAKKVQELVFPPRQQEREKHITKDRGISR